MIARHAERLHHKTWPSEGVSLAWRDCGVLRRAWAREGAGLEPLCALRLRNAMGSSCAWHRDGFHVALTFTSGDIAVVVGAAQWTSQPSLMDLICCDYC